MEKKHKRKLAVSVTVLIIFVIAGILFGYFYGLTKKQMARTVDFSRVTEICELATLKCYYHNVAELNKEADEGFFEWTGYGRKKLWIEYTGTIDLGIDADKVQVSEPNENDEVSVYVPDARIITVNVDNESMGDPISDTGVFTRITAEDQGQAVKDAREKMKSNAAKDKTLLKQAKKNAEKLIENYIITVGKKLGKNYTVVWVDSPES